MRAIFRLNRRPLPVVLAGACLICATGCQHMINPFADHVPRVEEVTTASVDGARGAPRLPSAPRRDFTAFRVESQPGTVSHWPLWWEDPFEDKGSEDGKFAWTWEDYLAMPWSYSRWFANVWLVSASIAVPQPFTVMASDGELSEQWLGYDHDAEPANRAAEAASKN